MDGWMDGKSSEEVIFPCGQAVPLITFNTEIIHVDYPSQQNMPND